MLLVVFLSNMYSALLPSKHHFLELSVRTDVGAWKRDVCGFFA